MLDSCDKDARKFNQYTNIDAIGPAAILKMLRAAVNKELVKHVIDTLNGAFSDIAYMQAARSNIHQHVGLEPVVELEFHFDEGVAIQPQDRDEIRNIMFNAGWKGCRVSVDKEKPTAFTVMVSDEPYSVFPT